MMADLETVQQKIIAFTPIEILTRTDVAQIAANVYDITCLPFRGILLNLTRGERNERDWAQFHDPLPPLEIVAQTLWMHKRIGSDYKHHFISGSFESLTGLTPTTRRRVCTIRTFC